MVGVMWKFSEVVLLGRLGRFFGYRFFRRTGCWGWGNDGSGGWKGWGGEGRGGDGMARYIVSWKVCWEIFVLARVCEGKLGDGRIAWVGISWQCRKFGDLVMRFGGFL